MTIDGKLSDEQIEELILHHGLSDKRLEKAYYRIARRIADEKEAKHKEWALAHGLKYP